MVKDQEGITYIQQVKEKEVVGRMKDTPPTKARLLNKKHKKDDWWSWEEKHLKEERKEVLNDGRII